MASFPTSNYPTSPQPANVYPPNGWTATPLPPPERDQDIDLRSFLSTLNSRRRVILLGTLVALLASIAYVVLATPKYAATAVVQVEERTPTVPGVQAQADAPVSSPGRSSSTTEIQLLTSRQVLGAAVESLGMDVKVEPVRFPIVGGYIARRFEAQPSDALAKPLWGMEKYAWGGEQLDIGSLEVTNSLVGVPMRLVAGENGSYALLNEGGDRLLQGEVGELATAEGVQIKVDQLRANPGTAFDVTRLDTLAILDALKQEVGASELGRDSGIIGLSYAHSDPEMAKRVLQHITQAYVGQNVARNSAEAGKRLEFVNQQLPKVRAEVDKAQAELTAFQNRTQTLDVALQNRSLLDQTVALDSSIQNLRIQQAAMAGRYTPQHPAYQALSQQIGQFEGQKAALRSSLGQLPETQQGLFKLTRNVEVTNRTYANLLDQVQQLDLARASAMGNTRIIDPAAVNVTSPASPKVVPVIAGGTALGALLMMAFVLLQQIFKRGVEDASEIEQIGLPVYASVPFSEKTQAMSLQPRRHNRRGQRLLALNAPGDLAMEALRTLRTSLHFSRFQTRNNVLMIAAPSPGVGKTFVCANLAVTMAQAGQRVLLIDADMRRGTLHQAVGTSSENGLSELISGQITLEAAVIDVVGTENLSFIPRGAIPPNPSELLMHPNFTQLLDRAAPSYDVVVIDTPPVLAVTDAALIGHHAGTCLMVVRYGVNQQQEIALAKQRLEQNGVEVKGAIFNGVRGDAGRYSYSYESFPAGRRAASA